MDADCIFSVGREIDIPRQVIVARLEDAAGEGVVQRLGEMHLVMLVGLDYRIVVIDNLAGVGVAGVGGVLCRIACDAAHIAAAGFPGFAAPDRTIVCTAVGYLAADGAGVGAVGEGAVVGASDAAYIEFIRTLAAHVGVVDTAGDGSVATARDAANGAVVGVSHFAAGDTAGESAVVYRAIVISYNAAYPGVVYTIRSHGADDV